jgi:hypothetical protein
MSYIALHKSVSFYVILKSLAFTQFHHSVPLSHHSNHLSQFHYPNFYLILTFTIFNVPNFITLTVIYLHRQLPLSVQSFSGTSIKVVVPHGSWPISLTLLSVNSFSSTSRKFVVAHGWPWNTFHSLSLAMLTAQYGMNVSIHYTLNNPPKA